MASTHTDVLLQEIKNGNVFEIGKFTLTYRNGKAVLLSNDSDDFHPTNHYNQLLSNFLTTSFPANGGTYKGQQISLVRKTPKSFKVQILTGAGKRTCIRNKSVGLKKKSPSLGRRSARLNGGSSGYLVLAELSVESIITSSTVTQAPPASDEQPQAPEQQPVANPTSHTAENAM